jgi:hypothetical protein
MDEIQQLAAQLKMNPDDANAWQKRSELIDDPQKKQDCLNQVTRIENKKMGFNEIISCEACGAWMSVYYEYHTNEKVASCPYCHAHIHLEKNEREHSKILKLNIVTNLISVIAIIGANLMPVVGVLFFGWDASSIILLYWIENLVVIGFYTLLKITFARAPGAKKTLVVSLFCVFYSLVWSFQGCYMFSYLARKFSETGEWLNSLTGIAWFIFGLFISHGVFFIQSYWIRKEYLYIPPERLALQPIPKIVLFLIILTISSSVVEKTGSTTASFITLIALKTGLELTPNFFKLLLLGFDVSKK